jgi:hypothetical protein
VTEGDATLVTYRYLAGDEHVSERETTVRSEAGDVLEGPTPARSAWRDLQAHASYPEIATEIAADRIEVPAGTYDCWRYEVVIPEEGGTEVTRAWFAKDLPGPPVRMLREVAGVSVFSMTLVEDTPGPGSEARPARG